MKRQRTVSELSSDNEDAGSQAGDSDGEGKGLKQRPRSAAARSQRDKDLKERERADAANKRKGRADRRRGEGRFSPDLTLLRPLEELSC